MSARRYLEMGVPGPIVWTRELQDPSHRDVQETDITLLSMDQGNTNIEVSPIGILE
jgi:hypothetical protein